MLGWILCHVFDWHKPHSGTNPKWALYWACSRCSSMQMGGLAKAARK